MIWGDHPDDLSVFVDANVRMKTPRHLMARVFLKMDHAATIATPTCIDHGLGEFGVGVAIEIFLIGHGDYAPN